MASLHRYIETTGESTRIYIYIYIYIKTVQIVEPSSLLSSLRMYARKARLNSLEAQEAQLSFLKTPQKKKKNSTSENKKKPTKKIY